MEVHNMKDCEELSCEWMSKPKRISKECKQTTTRVLILSTKTVEIPRIDMLDHCFWLFKKCGNNNTNVLCQVMGVFQLFLSRWLLCRLLIPLGRVHVFCCENKLTTLAESSLTSVTNEYRRWIKSKTMLIQLQTF